MKLNPINLCLASAVTMAFLWIVCSLLVLALPNLMMNMTGQMVHADLSNMNWTLTFAGFLVGLISWSLIAGIFGWLLAFIYNFLVK